MHTINWKNAILAGIAPSLFGPTSLRPFIFMTAETIALVWFFMFPLLGAGVAGVNMGVDMAIGSMVRHRLFAIPLLLIVNKTMFKQGN